MIGDLDLLRIFLTILRISDSGIVFHNTPDTIYSPNFTKGLKANLANFCFINIDDEPKGLEELCQLERVVVFDFGLKVNSSVDLPLKNCNSATTSIHIYKLDRLECVGNSANESSIMPPSGGSKNLEISLRRICMFNATHFGVEADGKLRTYKKNLGQMFFWVEGAESKKKYREISREFGYQECRTCRFSQEDSRIGSGIRLMSGCSHCRTCFDSGPLEDTDSELTGVDFFMIVVIVVSGLLDLIIVIICLRNKTINSINL